MRLLTYSLLACLGASAVTLPAAAADDVIINGLHCNALCQSWMGTGRETAASQAQAGPAPVIRVEPPIAPAPLRLATPAAEPAISQVRTAFREDPTPDDMPLRASTTDRGPMGPAAVAPLATPQRSGASRRPVAPRLVSLPTIDVSAPRITLAPAPKVPLNQASTAPAREYAEPAAFEGSLTNDIETSSPRRVKRRNALANAGMEPGLTTLPRLDDVVAVHGTIMIETAQERAANRRDMAELVKSTTRPKQFRTGFADPLSTMSRPSDQALSATR